MKTSHILDYSGEKKEWLVNNSMTRFIAFYPSRPFWMGGKPSMQGLHCYSGDAEQARFSESMSEEAYSLERNEYILKICRDGMIMLSVARIENDVADPNQPNIEESQARWGDYLDYLNAFYLLLDSATIHIARWSYFNLHEVTTRDAFAISFKGGKHLSSGVPSESVGSIFMMARYPRTYMAYIPVEQDHRISMRANISQEIVAYAAEQFDHAFTIHSAIRSLASFAKSLSEYKVGNYETSIVISWFIIESVLNRLWTDHLDSLNHELERGERRINSKRRALLTGRDFSASIISNILELAGTLPYSLFKELSDVRKYRNDIAHGNDYAPSADHARRALEAARAMIAKLWDINLALNMQLALTMI